MTSTTALTPMQAFQEKLKERVRQDIAQLLPEDAIQELVKRAIEDGFFAPIERSTPNYPYSEKVPSYFVQEVAKAAAPLIRKAVEDLVREKEAEIYARIRQAVEAGLMSTAFGAIDSMISTMVARALGRAGAVEEAVRDLIKENE